MGQVLQVDSIAKLAKGSGTQVSLPPSVITVGGQQYKNLSAITLDTTTIGINGLDTGSLGAHQLWYVHAIVNSGALALVASLSKTAPTGFSNFKWTGWAFWTNTASQVSLTTNKPRWNGQNDTLLAGFSNFGTIPAQNIMIWRDGGYLMAEGWFESGTTLPAEAELLLPTGLLIDSSRADATGVFYVGEFFQMASSATDLWPSEARALFAALDPTGIFVATKTASSVFQPANANSVLTSAENAAIRFRVPIAGWSEEL